MFSIQIDTKGLTTSNCPSLQAIWNRVFNYVRLIDAVRLLDSRCSRVRQRLPDFAEFEFQTPEWNKRRVNQSLEDFIMSSYPCNTIKAWQPTKRKINFKMTLIKAKKSVFV